MPLRARANVVCTQCHSRKIKCDLQTSEEGVCRNCRHSGHPCVQRNGIRKSQSSSNRLSLNRTPTLTQQVSGRGSPSSPISTVQSDNERGNNTHQNNEFVSHCSMIQLDEHVDVPVSENWRAKSLSDATLEATQVAKPPRPTLLSARTDAYLGHIFHHCPVIDPSEISANTSSVLLQQSICMLGDLIRHDSTGPVQSQQTYQRLKLLLSINYEEDCVQTLKSICLISCWGLKPSTPINVDGPWKWTGLGIQLVLQMGLHREDTYTRRENAGCLRRIFWQLYNNDALHVACWGVPPRLRHSDFDVRLPKLEDFEISNTQSVIFIEITKLCTIMASISELYMERRVIQQAELSKIVVALIDWVKNVPEDLRLYTSHGHRKSYYRPASEMFIQYFVAIVMSQMLSYNEKDRPWRVSLPSRIAASCATVLYDEIVCRDEAIFLLPNHGFFCMAISLPLICDFPQSEIKREKRTEEIAIIREILNKMRGRYGDADMVLGKMKRLQNTIEKSVRLHQELDGDTYSGTRRSSAHSKELFPFPPSMCNDIDFGEDPIDDAHEQDFDMNAIDVPLLPDEQSIPFGYNFIDLFELDLTAVDLSDSNHQNYYPVQGGFPSDIFSQS